MPHLRSEETLRRLLVEAKLRHAEYEQATGKADEDWPRWYAAYIFNALEQEEYEHAVNRFLAGD